MIIADPQTPVTTRWDIVAELEGRKYEMPQNWG
jgi:hypothetical protein